jgi:VanZ family protein
MKIAIKSFWPGVMLWLLSVLAFCIPGNVLPNSNWLGKMYVDKWIHVGLFGGLVFLWCVPFLYRSKRKSLTNLFLAITLAFFGYGVLMEFVQQLFVSKRSFDWGDIAADAVGCLIGFLLARSQWLTTSN